MSGMPGVGGLGVVNKMCCVDDDRRFFWFTYIVYLIFSGYVFVVFVCCRRSSGESLLVCMMFCSFYIRFYSNTHMFTLWLPVVRPNRLF